MFLDCPSVHRHARMHVHPILVKVILQEHPGEISLTRANVHLDSKMKLLNFGGQRSKFKVTVTSQNTSLVIIHCRNSGTEGENVISHLDGY